MSHCAGRPHVLKINVRAAAVTSAFQTGRREITGHGAPAPGGSFPESGPQYSWFVPIESTGMATGSTREAEKCRIPNLDTVLLQRIRGQLVRKPMGIDTG